MAKSTTKISKLAACILYIVNFVVMVTCVLIFTFGLWIIISPSSLSSVVSASGHATLKMLIQDMTLQVGIAITAVAKFVFFICFMGYYKAFSKTPLVLFMAKEDIVNQKTSPSHELKKEQEEIKSETGANKDSEATRNTMQTALTDTTENNELDIKAKRNEQGDHVLTKEPDSESASKTNPGLHVVVDEDGCDGTQDGIVEVITTEKDSVNPESKTIQNHLLCNVEAIEINVGRDAKDQINFAITKVTDECTNEMNLKYDDNLETEGEIEKLKDNKITDWSAEAVQVETSVEESPVNQTSNTQNDLADNKENVRLDIKIKDKHVDQTMKKETDREGTTETNKTLQGDVKALVFRFTELSGNTRGDALPDDVKGNRERFTKRPRSRRPLHKHTIKKASNFPLSGSDGGAFSTTTRSIQSAGWSSVTDAVGTNETNLEFNGSLETQVDTQESEDNKITDLFEKVVVDVNTTALPDEGEGKFKNTDIKLEENEMIEIKENISKISSEALYNLTSSDEDETESRKLTKQAKENMVNPTTFSSLEHEKKQEELKPETGANKDIEVTETKETGDGRYGDSGVCVKVAVHTGACVLNSTHNTMQTVLTDTKENNLLDIQAKKREQEAYVVKRVPDPESVSKTNSGLQVIVDENSGDGTQDEIVKAIPRRKDSVNPTSKTIQNHLLGNEKAIEINVRRDSNDHTDFAIIKVTDAVGSNETNLEFNGYLKTQGDTEKSENNKITDLSEKLVQVGTSAEKSPVNQTLNTQNGLTDNKGYVRPDNKVKDEDIDHAVKEKVDREGTNETNKTLQGDVKALVFHFSDLSGNKRSDVNRTPLPDEVEGKLEKLPKPTRSRRTLYKHTSKKNINLLSSGLDGRAFSPIGSSQSVDQSLVTDAVGTNETNLEFNSYLKSQGDTQKPEDNKIIDLSEKIVQVGTPAEGSSVNETLNTHKGLTDNKGNVEPDATKEEADREATKETNKAPQSDVKTLWDILHITELFGNIRVDDNTTGLPDEFKGELENTNKKLDEKKMHEIQENKSNASSEVLYDLRSSDVVESESGNLTKQAIPRRKDSVNPESKTIQNRLLGNEKAIEINVRRDSIDQIGFEIKKVKDAVGTNENNFEFNGNLDIQGDNKNSWDNIITDLPGNALVATPAKESPVNQTLNKQKGLADNKGNVGPDVNTKDEQEYTVKEKADHDGTTETSKKLLITVKATCLSSSSNDHIIELSGKIRALVSTEEESKSFDDNKVDKERDMEIESNRQQNQAMAKVINIEGTINTNIELQPNLDYLKFAELIDIVLTQQDGKENSSRYQIVEYLKDFCKPLIEEAVQHILPSIPQNPKGLDKEPVAIGRSRNNIKQPNDELQNDKESNSKLQKEKESSDVLQNEKETNDQVQKDKELNDQLHNDKEPYDQLERIEVKLEEPSGTQEVQKDLINPKDADNKVDSDELKDIPKKDHIKEIPDDDKAKKNLGLHDEKVLVSTEADSKNSSKTILNSSDGNKIGKERDIETESHKQQNQAMAEVIDREGSNNTNPEFQPNLDCTKIAGFFDKSQQDQTIEYLSAVFKPLIVEALQNIIPSSSKYGRGLEKELLQPVVDESNSIKGPNDHIQNKEEPSDQLRNEETERNDKLQNEKDPNYQVHNERERNDQLQNDKDPNYQVQNEKERNDQLENEKESNDELENVKDSNDQLENKKDPNYQLQNDKESNDQLQNEKALNDELQNNKESYDQLKNEQEPNDQLQKAKEPNSQLEPEETKLERLGVVQDVEVTTVHTESQGDRIITEAEVDEFKEKLIDYNKCSAKDSSDDGKVQQKLELHEKKESSIQTESQEVKLEKSDTPNFESTRIEDPDAEDSHEEGLLMDLIEISKEMIEKQQTEDQQPSEEELQEKVRKNNQVVEASDSNAKTNGSLDLGKTSSTTDGSKSESLQEPLRFHSVHGDNIWLSKNSLRAQRKKKSNFSSTCIAFSSRPVAIGEKVSLHLKQRLSSWLGHITIGFTTNDPNSIASNLPTNVLIERNCTDGFWAERLEMKYYQESCRLHYYLNSSGNMCFGVNGVDKIEFSWNLEMTTPVWALIDLLEYFTTVEFEIPKQFCFTSFAEKSSLLPGRNESGDSRNASWEDDHANKSCLNYQTSFVPLDLYTQFEGTCIKFLEDRGVCMCLDDEGGCINSKFPLFPGQTIVVQNLSAWKTLFHIGVKYCIPTIYASSELRDTVELKVYMRVKDEMAITFTENGEVQVTKNIDVPKTILKVSRSEELWPFVKIFRRNHMIKMWSSNTGVAREGSLAVLQL